MPWATANGVTIYYERDGEPDGETVVFLQELGTGRWLWRWQRQALSSTFDIVAPDTRGTGRSDVGIFGPIAKLPRRLRAPLVSKLFGYTVDEMAADLEAVLDEAGIYEAHLVGAGLGGMVAMRYALEYTRAASLVLCGTSHGGPDAVPIPEETRDQLFATESTRRKTIRERMRPLFSDRFTNRNPHLMDQLVEWRLEGETSDVAREAQLAAIDGFDVSEAIRYLREPTLIIHGSDDRVVPVENAHMLCETLPNSQLEIIEGGSHLCFVEDPDLVSDHLRDAFEAHAVQ